MKAWLKGGLIGGGIGIFVTYLSVFSSEYSIIKSYLIKGVFDLLVRIVVGFCGDAGCEVLGWYVLIVIFIIFFAIGFAIGVLIEKLFKKSKLVLGLLILVLIIWFIIISFFPVLRCDTLPFKSVLNFDDLCYLEVVRYTQNPEICYKMNERRMARAKCFYDFGLSLKNVSFCANVADMESSDGCFRKLAEDSSVSIEDCQFIADEKRDYTGDKLRDNCYYYFALERLDNQSCKNIGREITQNNCYKYITEYFSAIEGNDSQRCGNIILPSLYRKCYAEFATRFNDPELCEKIGSYTQEKNMCYSEFAIATNNPELCEKIKPLGNNLLQKECYEKAKR